MRLSAAHRADASVAWRASAARGAGGAHFPHLPRGQHANLMSSAAVTNVTGTAFILWTHTPCRARLSGSPGTTQTCSCGTSSGTVTAGQLPIRARGKFCSRFQSITRPCGERRSPAPPSIPHPEPSSPHAQIGPWRLHGGLRRRFLEFRGFCLRPMTSASRSLILH